MCSLGGGFNKIAPKLPREGCTLFLGDFPLEGFVTLVADKHKYWMAPLDANHRLAEYLQTIKCRP